MSSEIAIKVDNLSKCYQIYDKPRDRLMQMLHRGKRTYYREFWALRDVSFQIKRGETVGIIGRNGSGKSTLLEIICGTLSPTSGHIATTGRIAALLELGSGFNPDFTGRENIYMNGAVLGLAKEEIDSRFESIVSFADIGDFIDQPVKTYSSGMYVRLAFAIQANVDPEILIVDEALAVGDAYFVHRCMLRFHELKRSGTTILFVSHDANAVRNLCERVVWLNNGTMQAVGDASKVVDQYLAYVFDQKIVSPTTIGRDNNFDTAPEMTDSGLPIESNIPNIDRRVGNQKCRIHGVGLYDDDLNQINTVTDDQRMIIRMTVKNQDLAPDQKIVVGYIFRNSKGQEIASSNSQIEGHDFTAMSPGSYKTFRMRLKLPLLHPGSYAFSLALGYLSENSDVIIADRIENALVFDVAATKEVHVMMRIPTEFSAE